MYPEGCPFCSLHADSFDRVIVHLNHRDVTMLCVSRAPLVKLNAYKHAQACSYRRYEPHGGWRGGRLFDQGVQRLNCRKSSLEPTIIGDLLGAEVSDERPDCTFSNCRDR
jgi:Bacterial protein of unknown function (DUF899)